MESINGEISPAALPFRPLATSNCLLRHSTDHSRETDVKYPPIHAPSNAAIGKLEPGDSTRGRQSSADGCHVDRPVGTLPQNESASVEDETRGAAEQSYLRPCDLVRLINSAGLGTVINDRQLFRHRQSSPWIEPTKKRICLVSYVAFLMQKKHRKREGKTRRIAGKEVITFGEAKLILERQDYRCALTGLPLTPDNFALDHIVPVKQGGAFDMKNAQMVLKTVNRAKHTMSQQDFIQMCRNVAAYHSKQSSI